MTLVSNELQKINKYELTIAATEKFTVLPSGIKGDNGIDASFYYNSLVNLYNRYSKETHNIAVLLNTPFFDSAGELENLIHTNLSTTKSIVKEELFPLSNKVLTDLFGVEESMVKGNTVLAGGSIISMLYGLPLSKISDFDFFFLNADLADTALQKFYERMIRYFEYQIKEPGAKKSFDIKPKMSVYYPPNFNEHIPDINEFFQQIELSGLIPLEKIFDILKHIKVTRLQDGSVSITVDVHHVISVFSNYVKTVVIPDKFGIKGCCLDGLFEDVEVRFIRNVHNISEYLVEFISIRMPLLSPLKENNGIFTFNNNKVFGIEFLLTKNSFTVNFVGYFGITQDIKVNKESFNEPLITDTKKPIKIKLQYSFVGSAPLNGKKIVNPDDITDNFDLHISEFAITEEENYELDRRIRFQGVNTITTSDGGKMPVILDCRDFLAKLKKKSKTKEEEIINLIRSLQRVDKYLEKGIASRNQSCMNKIYFYLLSLMKDKDFNYENLIMTMTSVRGIVPSSFKDIDEEVVKTYVEVLNKKKEEELGF